MKSLRATTDILRVITTGAGTDYRVNWGGMTADNAAPPALRAIPNAGPLAAITTSTTTNIVDTTSGFTSGDTVNVKDCSIFNADATNSGTVRVEHFDGTNTSILAECILLPREKLELDETGRWTHYDSNNGIYIAASTVSLFNQSSASQGAGFATDTYLTGSFIKFPGLPKVGTTYTCEFDVTKTAAGTATPIVTVRLGTAGSTADTARNTLTFNAGTAAADVGRFRVTVVFRAVGSGATAVVQGVASLLKGATATTGLVNLVGQAVVNTSAGFDSTVAGLGIGVSLNGGTSASWTVTQVTAELENVK
jgi:hypothetical protein